MQLWKSKRGYEADRVYTIATERITANSGQPRVIFEESALLELADSIRRYGILQPLTVRQVSDETFELVAGERRLRAARMAGLDAVPCIVMAIGEEESSLLALIENIQRRDLNYIEEAAAMRRLAEVHGLSQEKIAEKLGKSQSAVANKLRLLKLSGECAKMLLENHLTERHARALLRLSGEDERMSALKVIIARGMNVAQTEQYIESLLQAPPQTAGKGTIRYLIKDVRLFLNSIEHNLDIMRRAGLDAQCGREETEDAITLTIKIPKVRNAAQ